MSGGEPTPGDDWRDLHPLVSLVAAVFSVFEPPLDKPNATSLHPDIAAAADDLAAPRFSNYLDEFLQAIRVFGFLEKPVFHELARHLQTRRLIAGDTLALDQDLSFYCVVDGHVQVFAETGRHVDSWDDDYGNSGGYQLLNEVGPGGTLSSLFTILSLFTEDVRISWQDNTGDQYPQENENKDVSHLDIANDTGTARPILRRASLSSSGSTALATASNPRFAMSPTRTPLVGGVMTPGSERSSTYRQGALPSEPGSEMQDDYVYSTGVQSEHKDPRNPMRQGTIARATVDTTLAVIPAEAFRRLTHKFPKASAHIVQVTFNAMHKYLGLTVELLRTEKAINELACHPLPNAFYSGGGMQRLRQRFAAVPHAEEEDEQAVQTEDDTVTDSDDYFGKIAHHRGSSIGSGTISAGSINVNTPLPDRPVVNQHRRARFPEKGATLHTIASSTSSPPISQTPSQPSSTNSPETPFRVLHPSRSNVQAGDLHTMAGQMNEPENYRPGPASRAVSYAKNWIGDSRRRSVSTHADEGAPATQAATTQDFDLRDEVMSSIAKSIGLLQPPLSDSTGASPLLSPLRPGMSRSPFPSSASMTPSSSKNALRNTAMFGSAFSNLSHLQSQDDASSVTSLAGMTPMSLSGLDNDVEILFFSAGSALARAGERNADGFLDVSIPQEESTYGKHTNPPGGVATVSKPPKRKNTTARPELKVRSSGQEKSGTSNVSIDQSLGRTNQSKPSKHLFTVKTGGIAGYLGEWVCGFPVGQDRHIRRLPTITCLGETIGKTSDRVVDSSKTIDFAALSTGNPTVLNIDASLDWQQVDAGQVLWRPGEPSDSFYMVLNGRLRALTEKEEGVDIVGEYGQGDTVGELDVITSSSRRTTLHAIRDTELARMPMSLFNAISIRLLRMIASRVRNEVDQTSINPRQQIGSKEIGRNNPNLKTVCILPSTRDVPVVVFATKLQAALEDMGAPTSFLTQASVTRHLGRHAFTKLGKLKAAGWLAEQEQRYRIVLYVADTPVGSPWTQTCIRQVSWAVLYDGFLCPGPEAEFVLIRIDRGFMDTRTSNCHPNSQGLIQPEVQEMQDTDAAAIIAFNKIKNKVQLEIQKYTRSQVNTRPHRPKHFSDFSRLARRLCGKSVGLVLGGGGARGILSIKGVIRALEDRGIPIDHIGGTSIGAFIGGLYAREGDILSSALRAKQFSGRMSSVWRILSDVTWPVVAYTTGHFFNRGIYKIVSGPGRRFQTCISKTCGCHSSATQQILLLPEWTYTTLVMRGGISVSLVALVLIVIADLLFAGASMTLVGLLPPLCDNGTLLVDGGYGKLLTSPHDPFPHTRLIPK
ncbi:hydrolase [Rhizoctonia solani AG-1 IA]|uniref:Lysophospholipase NTE1 n=1 Tax=Thanatephorus cucumeris (strain AG1-IA) TaxID=983506 RepID=L8WKW9_THACA|nr:hydrolase [Rhizoctonia solani AG-1 IA]